MLLVLAVVWIAFQDEPLPLLRQLVEGHIRWNLEVPARPQEVRLALRALAGLPGLDQTPAIVRVLSGMAR